MPKRKSKPVKHTAKALMEEPKKPDTAIEKETTAAEDDFISGVVEVALLNEANDSYLRAIKKRVYRDNERKFNFDLGHLIRGRWGYRVR